MRVARAAQQAEQVDRAAVASAVVVIALTAAVHTVEQQHLAHQAAATTAAIRIQAAYRGHCVALAEQEYREALASAMVATAVTAAAQVVEEQWLLTERAAATIQIQAAYRGRCERQRLADEAVLRAHTAYRRHCEQREYWRQRLQGIADEQERLQRIADEQAVCTAKRQAAASTVLAAQVRCWSARKLYLLQLAKQRTDRLTPFLTPSLTGRSTEGEPPQYLASAIRFDVYAPPLDGMITDAAIITSLYPQAELPEISHTQGGEELPLPRIVLSHDRAPTGTENATPRLRPTSFDVSICSVATPSFTTPKQTSANNDSGSSISPAQSVESSDGEDDMLAFVANYRQQHDVERQRAAHAVTLAHDEAVTAEAKVEVKRARKVAEREVWRARQAELDGAAKNNINAIREELARRREESRKARAMLQLNAKGRFDAKHKQADSPGRFVAGSRRGRGSGGRRSSEDLREATRQHLRHQRRPKTKEQQEKESRPVFGVMSASAANVSR